MIAKPWLAPELTAENRLPMHSVPHLDRVDLDGRWRFQLLHDRTRQPAPAWSEVDVPSCWTMAGSDDPHGASSTCPTTPTSRCRSRAAPPDLPAVNPTGVYEREFELPAGGCTGRRVVLHVGAAESVLIATVNGREVGVSKDSHLAAEFDVTEIGPAGRQRHLAPGRQVVRRHLHRGSGPVVARRHHPLGVSLRHAAGPPRRRPRQRRPGRRSRHRHLRADGRRRLRRRTPRRAGPSRPRSAERTLPGGDRAAGRQGTGAAGQPRRFRAAEPASLRAGREGCLGGLAGAEAAEWTELLAAAAAAARRPRVDPDASCPMSRAGRPSSRISTRCTSCCARPPARRSRRWTCGSASGGSRSTGVHLLINGAAVLIRGVNRHDFDQHTGRVISPESMRADLVAMKQFGFNAVRTSHYPNDPVFLDLTDELGMYVIAEADIEIARLHRRAVQRPALPQRLGGSGGAGWSGATRTTPR